MIDLTLNTELARTILTGFIQTEINRASFKTRCGRVVGGVDSALSVTWRLKRSARKTCCSAHAL